MELRSTNIKIQIWWKYDWILTRFQWCVKSAARTSGIGGDAVSSEWKIAFFPTFCQAPNRFIYLISDQVLIKPNVFPTFFFLEITIEFINSTQVQKCIIFKYTVPVWFWKMIILETAWNLLVQFSTVNSGISFNKILVRVFGIFVLLFDPNVWKNN